MSHRLSEPAIIRRCPTCGKRLSRYNAGPTCYACEPEGVQDPRAGRRPRRRRLPHDEIVALYREIGDTTAVAVRLALPRSSVWYAVQRAKQDGRLPSTEAA